MLIIILASVIGGLCGGLTLGVALWMRARKPFRDDYEWTSERGW